MKLYIRAARTVEQLETQEGTGLAKPVVKQLIELDPTANYEAGKGGKYCPWILRMHKNGTLKKEDYTNLKDALELFSKEYKKYPKSDLNQYKSVEEFLNDTHDVGNRELTDKEKAKMLKKQAHRADDQDKEFLIADGNWEVWRPLTYAGSISLAREGGHKAQWCTAYEGNDHYWRSYSSKGPLYIFLNKADPDEKYQTHFETNSWFYDIDDRELGQTAFINFCAEHPKIGKFFEVVSENGVMSRAGVPLQYDPKATKIILPENCTKLPDFRFPEACREVVLPDGVTDIPAGVFRGSNVVTVTANNIERIGANAFRDSAITNIDLTGVARIGSSAFRNCKNMTNLVLNTTDELTIGSYAFADDQFQAVDVLPTMHLSMAAFDGCPNLVVTWKAEDEAYEFADIKALVLDADKCPELLNANKGFITIKTTSGETYEADEGK